MDEQYTTAVHNLFNKLVQPTHFIENNKIHLRNLNELKMFTNKIFYTRYHGFPSYPIPTHHTTNLNLLDNILENLIAEETSDVTFDMLQSNINFIFNTYSKYYPEKFIGIPHGDNSDLNRLRKIKLLEKFIALYSGLPEPEPEPEPTPFINPNPTFEGHRFLPGGTRNKMNKKKRKINSKKMKIKSQS
jgi:hypothetical protein